MKSKTLVTTLTRLTTAMAVAAPIVVFGFLFVLKVHPERNAAAESRHRLAMAREELNRRQLLVRPQSVTRDVSALAEFEARINGGAGEVADMLTRVLKSPAIGGASNVAVETGPPEDAASDSTARLFSATLKQTPVMLTFDARYEQIGRFFRHLSVLPATFDLRSVELTPTGARGSALMRAKVSLRVFHQPGTATLEQASPTQVADGRERRVAIARPALPAAKR